MITKSEIENAIIAELEQVEGVVAKRELNQEIVTTSENTVFVKVKFYQFNNNDGSEDSEIYKEQLTIINIQIKIVYRTVNESSNISGFEEKVIKHLVALPLTIGDYSFSFALRPVNLGETTDLTKELKQSINMFKIVTLLDFNQD